MFLGNNGFRFPFAHFPTTEADPASLYTNFWKAVGWLRRFGFEANFCCCDGGEANRSFIKMHFQGKDPEEEKFTTINPYTRKPMVFLLDPSVSMYIYTRAIIKALIFELKQHMKLIQSHMSKGQKKWGEEVGADTALPDEVRIL